MEINYESGGGVAGMASRRRCTVTDKQLPADLLPIARSICQGQIPIVDSAAARPDDSYIELTVSDNHATKAISASRRSVPPEARPLIEWLEKFSLNTQSQ